MSAWLLLFTMLNPSSCQPVNGDRIVGSDLASVIPAFSAIPADAFIGYSPAPGAKRIFLFSELKRIGLKYGVGVPEGARACYQWGLRALTEEDVRTAIRESLRIADSQVQILDMSKSGVPRGKLVFPLNGLSVSSAIDPATPVTWKGYVQYDGTRKYATWARIRVSATTTRVVAVELLTPGQPVETRQVRLETYDDFPLRSDIARSLDEVIGRVPRRAIRAGLPVFRTDLGDPIQVRRGDAVQVTAISGATRLALEALAESSGRLGDVITFKNPSSGREFRARIEGKGTAVLVSPAAIPVTRVQ
jgi:flagella basal body P-ring formation protein FlgA